MSQDLHDDCLRILRTKGDKLTLAETLTLNHVAGLMAAGSDTAEDRKAANTIVWSFHSQGPGRAAG